MATRRSTVVQPSWRKGFARSKGVSEAPEQWDGLVGLWAPFLGPQGNTLYDISRYGAHGTLTNMDPATDWVTVGERGIGLDFDRTNDVVTLPRPIVLNIPMTVMAWVRTADTSNELTIFDIGQTGSSSQNHRLYLLTTVGVVSRNTGSSSAVSSTAFPASTWFHACGVWIAQNSRRAYLNGGSEGTSALDRPTSDANESIIGDRSGGGALFSGQIGEIRVYNYALSQAQIHAIYADSYALYRLRRRKVFRVGAAAQTIDIGGVLSLAGGARRDVSQQLAGVL